MNKAQGPIVKAVTKAILDSEGYIEYHKAFAKGPIPDIYYNVGNQWGFKMPLRDAPKITHLREI